MRTYADSTVLRRDRFIIHVIPNADIPWDDLPDNSIALDGIVKGGPRLDPMRRRQNFDHHDSVVREATMSTCKQVYFAIKGGLFQMFEGCAEIHLYLNDPDQDTAYAVYLLLHHARFEGTNSIPHINRLLTHTDCLDITAGAFPMKLDERIMKQHAWVFGPYTKLRKTGALAKANSAVMANCLEAVLARLEDFYLGQARRKKLDIRYTILFDHPRFKVVHEIGGNEARYFLFSEGLNAYISLVGEKENGRKVISVGRRSQYITWFPVPELYDAFNEADGLHNGEKPWGGSDIVGGCRNVGTGLSWEQLRDITVPIVEKTLKALAH